MPDAMLPRYVLDLMERLEEAGEEVYAVGGSLRDTLLGTKPHDFDLATSALPERTAAVFDDHRVILTGLKHGTVTVLSEGNPVEITTFRIDGSYTDSRHPDSVTFTRRITDDLSRRDFTVNAMAYHPRVGLVDPFGGQEDLHRRILRAVGDPKTRFTEDALRIMRAFRFSAQLDFTVHGDTLRAACETREGLSSIAEERIASEFLRLLLSPAPEWALREMIEGGVLPYVTGAYRPSAALLSQLADLPPEDAQRLGHFFADADESEAGEILKKLKYSNKQITGALAVLRGSRMEVRTPADARRLIARCGDYAPFAVRSSICLGRSVPEAKDWVAGNRAPCRLADLAVGGRDLMSVGIGGKAVGEMLNRLLDAVLEDPALNRREILLTLAQNQNQKHILNRETEE